MPGSNGSLRNSILETAKSIAKTSEVVDVSQWWGTKVRVRKLNALERIKLGAMAERRDLEIHVAMWAALDPDTLEPIFTKDDFDAVAALDYEPIQKIAEECIRLSKLGTEDALREKEGSEASLTGSSPTD